MEVERESEILNPLKFNQLEAEIHQLLNGPPHFLSKSICCRVAYLITPMIMRERGNALVEFQREAKDGD